MAARPRRRSLSRLNAVQALYQIDLTKETPQAVIAEFTEKPFSVKGNAGQDGRMDIAWFRIIIEGVAGDQEAIDDMVRANLTVKWKFERLEMVLKAILRAGVYELMRHGDVPKAVIINEYMEIAHAFFDEDEPGLINGLLDKIGTVLREGR